MNATRIVKVEAEVVTVTGEDGFFICNIFRGGKKVDETVKAYKDGIVEKALRAYSARLKPCEFQVTLRPERSRSRT